MELGDFCNLHELLHKYCYIRYTTKHVLGWLIDICNALQFLHGSHTFAIMHGDLKPANVLLFESGNLAKLIDFGSAIKSNLEVQVAGSLSWAPPELLRLNVYTEKSDVYSFGIIAWECFTRQLPVSQTQTLRISTTQLMYEIAKKGHSLDSLPVEFSQINAMTHMCTRFDPSQRPTTDDIHDYLFMLDNKEQSKKFPLVNDLKSECSNVMNLVYSMNIEKDRDMTKIISILETLIDEKEISEKLLHKMHYLISQKATQLAQTNECKILKKEISSEVFIKQGKGVISKLIEPKE
ncbi:MAG: Mitogen-activated protein kinase kinase kinase 7 [Marteilia pararefringens]